MEGCASGLSFTASTKVAMAQGEQAIGTIHPGEKVEAYNPQTHQMELEPVLHVWINHDNDLVDLTLTTLVPARHGKPATKTSEVIHTNKKHPFLTKEKGFLPVGQIKLGMHVLRANGTYGVVTGWKSVPGTSVMYNLEVAQDHTYTVGAGQWVVHNCDLSGLTSGKAWDQVSKLQNIFSKELNERSLEGAWKDLRGIISGVKSEEEGGEAFDHLRKVEQGIRGLKIGWVCSKN